MEGGGEGGEGRREDVGDERGEGEDEGGGGEGVEDGVGVGEWWKG